MSEPNAIGRTTVRVIPATMQRYAASRPLTAILRVAAYARVSTDEEEQQTSYEAQVDYYTKKITDNPEWTLVEVYADEGISGTDTKKRRNFNRMIEDALAGKIDRIITKSVSRFARNTVDTLTTIRKLKEKGVGVMFEKENIDTLDSKGELLITIMSSLAQEESRSISENVTWGWRKRISDGKVSVGYSHFLGYEKGPKGANGEEGRLQIVESEAEVVREIYRMFLDGQTPSSIAAILTGRGVPTPAGKQKWQNSTVRSILTNEKYKGDALLQKTFTADFLTKKAQVNRGEVPQYYVENSHPAIISPEVFDLVQYEIARRSTVSKHTSAVSVFSNKLVCGECGAFFGSKVWHSNDPYRCVIWRCNRKYDKRRNGGAVMSADGEELSANQASSVNQASSDTLAFSAVKTLYVNQASYDALASSDAFTASAIYKPQKVKPCHTPHVREEEIKAAFCTALSQLIERKAEIVDAYELVIAELTNTDKPDKEMNRVQTEIDEIESKLNQMIRDNAMVAQDQDEYDKAFNALAAKCDALKERRSRISEQLSEKRGRRRQLEDFVSRLMDMDSADTFDEHVFAGTVERVAVNRDEARGGKKPGKSLTFRFKDGTEIIVK